MRDLENELKLEIARLRAIESAMPDPYYVRDMDYNILLWPPAIAELTGYSAEEAKTLKCYDIFKAAVCPPRGECPTQNCVISKQFLRDVAVDVYHKNGGIINSLVSNAGIYDEDENAIGAVEIIKDNTLIKRSMDSIGELIKKLESEAINLAGTIEVVNKRSEKVNENLRESLNEIQKGVKSGNIVYEKTEHSTNHAGSVQINLDLINKSMLLSVGKVAELKLKTEDIRRFVSFIQGIANKTKVLAINASIEAAHAGEAGEKFEIVADGIRELSKDAAKSADSIEETISEVTELVKETTNSFKLTEKDIVKGTNNINELLMLIEDIDGSVKTLMDTLKAIENAALSVSNLTEEKTSLINEMVNVSGGLHGIAKELTYQFDRIAMSIRRADMG